jgi:hypothetical protein
MLKVREVSYAEGLREAPSRIDTSMSVIGALHDNGLFTCVANADFCVGACLDVVIAVWRKRTQPDGIAVVREVIDDRAVSHKRIRLLQIIEDEALPPDGLARQALGKLHLEQAYLIDRSAVVYEKPGITGTTARAIITGVAMLNPPSFEHLTFSSVPSALQWLYASQADSKASNPVSTVGQAVASLRASGARERPRI